jgi:16S rRNA processing protein RimM
LEDHFLIAEIASVYNDDGYVKVKSFSDFPERFFLLEKVYINIFGDLRTFIVEDVQEIGKFFILKFKNFNSESSVDFLVGTSIFVNNTDSVSLDKDTFFIHDLIGCKVFFNTKFFGNVVDVLNLNSSDIYVLNDENGHERLIPAVSDFVETVNIKEKKISLKIDFDEFSDDEN